VCFVLVLFVVHGVWVLRSSGGLVLLEA